MSEENEIFKSSGPRLNIAVIGAGLVGSLCACYLGRQGHNVTVYEYRDDIKNMKLKQGRSVNLALSVRGRMALRNIGLESKVINKYGIPMFGRIIHKLDGRKCKMIYDPVFKQCIYSVNRMHLNEILIEESKKYKNVNAMFKMKLVSLDSKTNNMKFLRIDTNETVQAEADLVIGADGAYSTVRKEFLKQLMYYYSQEYIDHYYIELCIPPNNKGDFAMEPFYFHLWPRKEFLMIALPNPDKSFTATLFMTLQKFKELNSPDCLLNFYKNYFSDFLNIISPDVLIHDYFSTTPSALISIKCHPCNIDNKVLLIGDAAHAMVPFYGQGMNAGFEDCSIFDSLMIKHKNNLDLVLPKYSEMRCPDAKAICDLAMYNFLELRHLVNKKNFQIHKKLDDILHGVLGEKWLPLYYSVTFTEINYNKCLKIKQFQDKVLLYTFFSSITIVSVIILVLLW